LKPPHYSRRAKVRARAVLAVALFVALLLPQKPSRALYTVYFTPVNMCTVLRLRFLVLSKWAHGRGADKDKRTKGGIRGKEGGATPKEESQEPPPKSHCAVALTLALELVGGRGRRSRPQPRAERRRASRPRCARAHPPQSRAEQRPSRALASPRHPTTPTAR